MGFIFDKRKTPAGNTSPLESVVEPRGKEALKGKSFAEGAATLQPPGMPLLPKAPSPGKGPDAPTPAKGPDAKGPARPKAAMPERPLNPKEQADREHAEREAQRAKVIEIAWMSVQSALSAVAKPDSSREALLALIPHYEHAFAHAVQLAAAWPDVRSPLDRMRTFAIAAIQHAATLVGQTRASPELKAGMKTHHKNKKTLDKQAERITKLAEQRDSTTGKKNAQVRVKGRAAVADMDASQQQAKADFFAFADVRHAHFEEARAQLRSNGAMAAFEAAEKLLNDMCAGELTIASSLGLTLDQHLIHALVDKDVRQINDEAWTPIRGSDLG